MILRSLNHDKIQLLLEKVKDTDIEINQYLYAITESLKEVVDNEILNDIIDGIYETVNPYDDMVSEATSIIELPVIAKEYYQGYPDNFLKLQQKINQRDINLSLGEVQEALVHKTLSEEFLDQYVSLTYIWSLKGHNGQPVIESQNIDSVDDIELVKDSLVFPDTTQIIKNFLISCMIGNDIHLSISMIKDMMEADYLLFASENRDVHLSILDSVHQYLKD